MRSPWWESLQSRSHQNLMWRIYVSRKCTENSRKKPHCQSSWQKKEHIRCDTWEDVAKNCFSPRQSWQILLWRTITQRQREFQTSCSANPHQNFSIACLLLAFVALVQNWCRLDLLLLHMSIKSFHRVARLSPLCPRTVQYISYPIWARSDNTRDGCMLNTSLAMLSSISHWCSST